jgi:hypothetical protein
MSHRQPAAGDSHPGGQTSQRDRGVETSSAERRRWSANDPPPETPERKSWWRRLGILMGMHPRINR